MQTLGRSRTDEMGRNLITVHGLRPYPPSPGASLFSCCSAKQVTTLSLPGQSTDDLPIRTILAIRSGNDLLNSPAECHSHRIRGRFARRIGVKGPYRGWQTREHSFSLLGLASRSTKDVKRDRSPAACEVAHQFLLELQSKRTITNHSNNGPM